ncbi:MAG: DUF2752 domain-containing protein [Acidobacteriota bacterium]
MKQLPAETPHLIVLFVCLFIIGGAFILKPPTKETPYLRLGPLPLPEICTFNNITNLPCPGCGLTRSMVALAHGQLKASLAHHRLGIVTFFYLLLQIIYRTALILSGTDQHKFLSRSGKILNKGFLFLAFLFAVNWIFNLVDVSLL